MYSGQRLSDEECDWLRDMKVFGVSLHSAAEMVKIHPKTVKIYWERKTEELLRESDVQRLRYIAHMMECVCIHFGFVFESFVSQQPGITCPSALKVCVCTFIVNDTFREIMNELIGLLPEGCVRLL